MLNYHLPARLLSKNHLCHGPSKARIEGNIFNFPVRYKFTIVSTEESPGEEKDATWTYLL